MNKDQDLTTCKGMAGGGGSAVGVFALMSWWWEQHLGVLELKHSYSTDINKRKKECV